MINNDDRAPRESRPAPSERWESPTIAAFTARFDAARSERAALEVATRFWRLDGASSPIAETADDDTPILTFLWRSSSAGAILLFVNRVTDADAPRRFQLLRVAGTDVWHLSLSFEPHWRGSYGFVVHEADGEAPWRAAGFDRAGLRALLGGARPDPRNPRACPGRAASALSVAEMPGAPPQPWAIPARGGGAAPAPSTGPDGRRCWVHASPPSGSGAAGGRPLWLVLDGEMWAERFDLGAALDAMVAAGAAPPLCALLIDSGTARNDALSPESDLPEVLAERYLPWAREVFAESFPAERCGVAGQSLGGLMSLRCAIERPDAFGLALAQSPSLWMGAPDLAGLAAHRDAHGGAPRFRLEVGSREDRLLEPVRRLHERLSSRGLDSELREYSGGHDYACWRGGLSEGISALSA